MIRINLLPRKRKAVQVGRDLLIGLSFLVLLICVGLGWFFQLNVKIKRIQQQIAETERQIESSKAEVEKIKKLQAEKQELERKLGLIKDLKSRQIGPAPLLHTISLTIPEEIWLASLSTKGKQLELEGRALTANKVASFMKSLEGSELLNQVELQVTAQETLVDKKIQKFKITCNLADKGSNKADKGSNKVEQRSKNVEQISKNIEAVETEKPRTP